MAFKPGKGTVDYGPLIDITTTPYQPTQPKPTQPPTQATKATIPKAPTIPTLPPRPKPTQPTKTPVEPNTTPKPTGVAPKPTQPKPTQPKPTQPKPTQPPTQATSATQPKPTVTQPQTTQAMKVTPAPKPVAKRAASIYHIQALTSPSGRGPESVHYVGHRVKGKANGKKRTVTKAMIKKDVENVKKRAAELKKAKAKAKKLAARKRLARAKRKLMADKKAYARQHKKGARKKGARKKVAQHTSKSMASSLTDTKAPSVDQSASFAEANAKVNPNLMYTGPNANVTNPISGQAAQADNTLQQLASQGAAKSDIAPIPNAPQASAGSQIQLGN